MALDKEYFDSIHIDVVKKKYYNANKVEAVFSDIRRQAEALEDENRLLKARLELFDNKKFEIGDAVLSAQAIYREIVDKARSRADEIVAAAEAQSEELHRHAMSQQEYAVKKVEACYARVKEHHLACIEAVNQEWQEFLCGLFPEEAPPSPPAAKRGSRPEPEALPEPDDLEEKIGAIARELFSIGQDAT